LGIGFSFIHIKSETLFIEVFMKVVKQCILLCTVLIFVCGIISPKNVSGITIQEEEELSHEFMKLILSHYEIIRDPLIVNYVNKVGQKIVSTLPPQPFSYHFYVIKEDTYNAFATPAGHIFVYSGLLEAMDSEEELACILAHEISHVLCRHISQKIERAKKVNIATLAGVVAGVLLGTAGASAAANAVTLGSLAAGQSYALAYGREDERQADQIGLNLLRKAGYNGIGLITTLKKMRSKRWFDSNQIPTYLTTHPASEERMAYIDTWLEKHKKTENHIDDYPFNRAHTRLVAIYGDESVALRTFKSEVHNHPDDPLAYYGYGLILDRKGEHKAAETYLKAALEKRAFDPYFLKESSSIGNYAWHFVFFKVVITMVACFAVAFLSGLLSEQLRRTKKELSVMQERVERVEKMAYLGEMATGITHEVKNPLASLAGSIQILRKDIPYNPEHDKLMQIVLRETDRLNALVSNFLLFAKPPVGKIERVDLESALAETIKLFEKNQGCRSSSNNCA